MKNYRFYKAFYEHEKWLNSDKKEGMQLILKNEDLSFIEIIEKDLSEAIIENCNLQRAVIENSNFKKTIFSHSIFSYTIINNSKFDDVYIINCDFEGVHFTNVSYENTKFFGSNFKKVIFDKLSFIDSKFYNNKNNKNINININYIGCIFQREKVVNSKYERCKFHNCYIDSYIKNSKYIDSEINNSLFLIKEENNIYLNTSPKNFFNHKVYNIDNDLYFENFQKEVDDLEKEVLNISLKIQNYSKKETKIVFDIEDIINNYKLYVLELYNKLEKNKYYLNYFQNDKIIKALTEKLMNIENLLKEKTEIIMNMNFKGNNSE